MARVAVVTGGTRGIGAAISTSLKEAGYTVAANYGGNDEAAAKFKGETGIPVYKFDVSDAAACEAGVRTVESELGPVDVLVNNAGITRDGMFHRMTFEQWQAVIRTNLDSMFTCTRPVIDGMRSRGLIGADGWLTATGRQLKERIEALTDELAAPAYDILQPYELDQLIEDLEPLAGVLDAASQ